MNYQETVLTELLEEIAADIMMPKDHPLYDLFVEMTTRVLKRKITRKMREAIEETKRELGMPKEQTDFAPLYVPVENDYAKMEIRKREWERILNQ